MRPRSELLEYTRKIRDPIHDYIPVTELECRVLDSPAFQRLDRIGQMHSVNKVYPSAAYSRKVHSLGAMHLAGQAIVRLLYFQDTGLHSMVPSVFLAGEQTRSGQDDVLDDLSFLRAIPDRFDELGADILDDLDATQYGERVGDMAEQEILDAAAWLTQAVRLLGLVHDCGHGPFSHMLEHLDPLDFSHEEMAPAVLELIKEDALDAIDEDNRFSHDDRGIAADVLEFVTLILEVGESNQETLSDLVFLWELVDCPYDCDMLDYVVRDAYYAGTLEYGQTDVSRILQGLVVNEGRLRMSKSQLSAVNNAFESLFDMYATVYSHPTVRMYDIILNQALSGYADRLADIIDQPSDFVEYDDARLTTEIKNADPAEFDSDEFIEKMWEFDNRAKPYVTLSRANFSFNLRETTRLDPIDTGISKINSALGDLIAQWDEEVIYGSVYPVKRVGLDVQALTEWVSSNVFYDPRAEGDDAFITYYDAAPKIRERLLLVEVPVEVFIERGTSTSRTMDLQSAVDSLFFRVGGQLEEVEHVSIR